MRTGDRDPRVTAAAGGSAGRARSPRHRTRPGTAAVAKVFHAAVATAAITPGDWHAFVQAHAPDMRNSAIRAWFNQRRLPARAPAAAARMLARVEAWLDDRRGGSSG